MSDKIFDYQPESSSEKLLRKTKENPFMVIGLLGLVAACGYGGYAYKHKGGMSTSVFLMQFRVIAQGAVVGSLSAGILYTMINDYVLKKDR